jgi:hypothetical protein
VAGVVLRGRTLEGITALLAVQVVVHLGILMLAQAGLVTLLHHQALLILMLCKVLGVGQMLLLVQVTRLPVVVVVQVGRGALLQELLSPAAVWLAVLVLRLHFLALQ